MKKQQQYHSALTFLSSYLLACSHLELLTKSQLPSLLKNPSLLQQIQTHDDQSKYHRLKSYKQVKESKTREFNDMIFQRYLPRLRFARSVEEVLGELERGIELLEKHVEVEEGKGG